MSLESLSVNSFIRAANGGKGILMDCDTGRLSTRRSGRAAAGSEVTLAQTRNAKARFILAIEDQYGLAASTHVMERLLQVPALTEREVKQAVQTSKNIRTRQIVNARLRNMSVQDFADAANGSGLILLDVTKARLRSVMSWPLALCTDTRKEQAHRAKLYFAMALEREYGSMASKLMLQRLQGVGALTNRHIQQAVRQSQALNKSVCETRAKEFSTDKVGVAPVTSFRDGFTMACLVKGFTYDMAAVSCDELRVDIEKGILAESADNTRFVSFARAKEIAGGLMDAFIDIRMAMLQVVQGAGIENDEEAGFVARSLLHESNGNLRPAKLERMIAKKRAVYHWIQEVELDSEEQRVLLFDFAIEINASNAILLKYSWQLRLAAQTLMQQLSVPGLDDAATVLAFEQFYDSYDQSVQTMIPELGGPEHIGGDELSVVLSDSIALGMNDPELADGVRVLADFNARMRSELIKEQATICQYAIENSLEFDMSYEVTGHFVFYRNLFLEIGRKTGALSYDDIIMDEASAEDDTRCASMMDRVIQRLAPPIVFPVAAGHGVVVALDGITNLSELPAVVA